MNKFFKFLLFLLLVAAVASASCWVTHHLFPPRGTAVQDPHAWIHEQLHLTPEQNRKLEPSEARYHRRHQHLLEEIALANMELGQAVLEEGKMTPRVRAAIEKVHRAQGELQLLIIDHVFEMREFLTEEQYQRLLSLTADALYRIDQKP